MNWDIILNQIPALYQGFIKSPFFFTLKFVLAIYTTVLFANIIILIIFRGMKDVRTTFRGMNYPMVSSKKMRKKWNEIMEKMDSNEQSKYKLAIIEADAIVDKLIGSMGLKGNDMIERLDTLRPAQMEEAEDLKKYHRIRNQIIHDPNFEMSKETAMEILKFYEKFLVNYEFMD
ncbi:MAG: hypothetical protein V1804_03160 [Patescibacteria group bacterium]